MEWKYLIFSFIDIDFLLKLFFEDKSFCFTNKLVKYYIKKYYFIKNKKIKLTNPSLEFINFYPRIKDFEINLFDDDITKINSDDDEVGRYIYNGIRPIINRNYSYNRFISSDKILPSPLNSSIPFSLGITKKEKFKLILSNIFYFEIYLDTFNFREPFEIFETFKLGFTNVLTNSKNIQLGKKYSFGIDIYEHKYISNKETLEIPKSINKGDTIGFGIIYNNEFNRTPFITLNGKLIEMNIKPLNINYDLKVILSMRMSTGIDVNFGVKEFKFDIENYINKNKLIYSSKKNFLSCGFNMENYLTQSILDKSNLFTLNENIYNLIV